MPRKRPDVWSELRRLCLAMPGASVERKWGNVDTCLVHRKMFAIFVLDEKTDAPQDFWLKAGADRFLELTDLPGMRAAPYLARAHWVATKSPQQLALAMWQPLVANAWEEVARGLPQYRQRALGLEPRPRPRRTPLRLLPASRGSR